jgi:predicted nicotinamide N-methyase
MESKVCHSYNVLHSLGTESNQSALLANSLVQARLAGSDTEAVLPLDFSLLRSARVMELGAGTGLLGIILAPLVGFYTFTDLPELCRLIEKNINLNIDQLERPPLARTSSPVRRKKSRSNDDAKFADRRPANIAVEPLDWVALHKTPSYSRTRLFPVPDPPMDLILATDTIYNPALVSPFLATLNHYTADQRRTVVFIVMELRDEDVTREFLHQWINLPGWRIWRTDGADASEVDIAGLANIPATGRLLDERLASWVAWKE